MIVANILAQFIVRVRGVVLTRLGNVKHSWMFPFVLLLDALVEDLWHDEDFSCVWKCG